MQSPVCIMITKDLIDSFNLVENLLIDEKKSLVDKRCSFKALIGDFNVYFDITSK